MDHAQIEQACEWLNARTGPRIVVRSRADGNLEAQDWSPQSGIGFTPVKRNYDPFPQSLDSMRLLLEACNLEERANIAKHCYAVYGNGLERIEVQAMMWTAEQLWAAWCAVCLEGGDSDVLGA